MSIDNAIIYAKFKDGWRVLEAQWVDELNFFEEWSIGYYETIRQFFFRYSKCLKCCRCW